MAELAQLLICDKSNVTAIVDKLEEQGWVRRIRGKAGDRRFMRVILTESGWDVRQLVMDAHGEWVRRRMAVLDDDRLDELMTLLRSLHGAMQVEPEPVVADALAPAGSRVASGSAS